MTLVREQANWNPYSLFGTGVRVVQFEDVFQTPDFHEVSELKRQSAGRENRMMRWYNDQASCGFNEGEGMTSDQLDRMVLALSKTYDLSDIAYDSKWTPCTEECNHSISRKQPWFKAEPL
ncbi:hypothetical protein GNI_110630 [Gregarina niphandrodes]|uniref:Uncharacterized protein n=1 Tax=Gregarina niphandrodes TaxID=110365 RepID=A0A023B3X2_GRENI|nr:hypothetical protein GNI_110630 [Gregarina niphandrodes]EZG55607.1 hypothetical protein GNI_110630 [Gregarina niphandrodes]|eukprot:XP_011131484.1 hypothetical protein GNI_110630 [Gregarina niphandrodes]